MEKAKHDQGGWELVEYCIFSSYFHVYDELCRIVASFLIEEMQ